MIYQFVESAQAHGALIEAGVTIFAVMAGLCFAETVRNMWRRQ
jgi:hypothetical protein